MVELPLEIWELITGYLSESNLNRLIGVNRLLYHLVLDRRYKEVSVRLRDHQSLHLLGQVSYALWV